MISMPKVQSIRRRRMNGESIASIARSENVSEPTVRKYLKAGDLSPRPPVKRKHAESVIDRYVPVIEQWLAEDRCTWRKQRHTATRIWERLRDEYGAEVSLSTVTRKVAQLRREFAAEREAGYLDLVWHPGEAQADFGEVDVRFRGEVSRMRHFVLDFPYSNVGPSQLMPGENAECACQALRDIFEWLGGVPPRIVFDNAAGVGRRMFERVRLTRLFQSFQAHYGFEYVFCNAYAGHEKGGVESRVGAVRRKLFVPVPSVWSMPAFNVRLLERCLALGDKDHYRKGGRETDLFAEDRKALLALPETRFDVVTWKRMKADKYGIVTVEGRHRYAAGPEHAGRELIVGLRAFEVELLDASGARITTHPRAYGDNPTSSDDRAMFIYREGQSTLAFYGYEWAGVDRTNGKSVYYVNDPADPKAGDFLYNGRGATYDYNQANYTVIGNAVPKVYGGVNTSVSWKGIDLALNFTYRIGGSLYDGAYMDVADDGYYWERIHAKNYYDNLWTPSNPDGTEPRIEGVDLTDAQQYSSRHVHNASYLRLKTLSLGYTLPRRWTRKASISSARLFFNGSNLWTIAKYKDADPEVSEYGTRGWETPIGKTFVFGIELKF